MKSTKGRGNRVGLNYKDRCDLGVRARRAAMVCINGIKSIADEYIINHKSDIAFSNLETNIRTITSRNTLMNRLNTKKEFDALGFDVLITRRKDNFVIPVILDACTSLSQNNISNRKPHSVKGQITQSQCEYSFIYYYFLDLYGLVLTHLTEYNLYSGRELWEESLKYKWGSNKNPYRHGSNMMWIKLNGLKTERNLIEYCVKDMGFSRDIAPIMEDNELLTSSVKPTLKQAIDNMFTKEERIRL